MLSQKTKQKQKKALSDDLQLRSGLKFPYWEQFVGWGWSVFVKVRVITTNNLYRHVFRNWNIFHFLALILYVRIVFCFCSIGF